MPSPAIKYISIIPSDKSLYSVHVYNTGTKTPIQIVFYAYIKANIEKNSNGIELVFGYRLAMKDDFNRSTFHYQFPNKFNLKNYETFTVLETHFKAWVNENFARVVESLSDHEESFHEEFFTSAIESFQDIVDGLIGSAFRDLLQWTEDDSTCQSQMIRRLESAAQEAKFDIRSNCSLVLDEGKKTLSQIRKRTEKSLMDSKDEIIRDFSMLLLSENDLMSVKKFIVNTSFLLKEIELIDSKMYKIWFDINENVFNDVAYLSYQRLVLLKDSINDMMYELIYCDQNYPMNDNKLKIF